MTKKFIDFTQLQKVNDTASVMCGQFHVLNDITKVEDLFAGLV